MLGGIIVYNVQNYQRAVDLGLRAYTDRHGQPPTHVALPASIDPAGLVLNGLQLSRQPASLGTVQLLAEEGNGHGPTEPAPEPEPEPAPPPRAPVVRWGCSARCGDVTAWAVRLDWCPTCGAKLERIEL